ncbi:MAG TPA: hypothetical protein VLB44_14860 [Kofleriaceae bacterium]|nr:hypothetical protein [Kofleriaceae bacterium]
MKSLFTSLLAITLCASCAGDDAMMAEPPVTLTVTGAGGTGNVTAASDPAGILCGASLPTCSAMFAFGARVHLSISGGTTCPTPTCTISPATAGETCSEIVMDQDKHVQLACP